MNDSLAGMALGPASVAAWDADDEEDTDGAE